MVGSNGTIKAIRIVRSKLRKREEHSNSVHPTDVVLQTSPTNNNINANPQTQQQQQQQQVQPAEQLAYRGQFLWQSTPQPCMYNNNSQVNTIYFVFIIDPSSTTTPLPLFFVIVIKRKLNNTS